METEMDKIREELLNLYLNIKIRSQDEVSINLSFLYKHIINYRWNH